MVSLAVVLGAALVVALALLLVCLRMWQQARQNLANLSHELAQLRSAKQSQSTRYGQITEQFAPFMAQWPWDPKRFQFIGNPIDGLQFTDEGIVFVEIKSSRSRLSAVQRQVRDHVQAGRVAWHEFRID